VLSGYFTLFTSNLIENNSYLNQVKIYNHLLQQALTSESLNNNLELPFKLYKHQLMTEPTLSQEAQNMFIDLY